MRVPKSNRPTISSVFFLIIFRFNFSHGDIFLPWVPNPDAPVAPASDDFGRTVTFRAPAAIYTIDNTIMSITFRVLSKCCKISWSHENTLSKNRLKFERHLKNLPRINRLFVSLKINNIHFSYKITNC